MILNAFRAELIKARGTSLWRMTVLFPLACAFTLTLFWLIPHDLPKRLGFLVLEGVVNTWLRFFGPLFAIMFALAIYNDEHNLGMWKHLNALPSRGRVQIFAKHLVGVAAGTLSVLCLVVFSAAALFALTLLRPEANLELEGADEWLTLAHGVLLALLSNLGVIAPLLLVAGRARLGTIGFTLGLGATAMVLGNMVTSHSILPGFIPWSFGWVHSEILDHGPRAADLGLYALLSTPAWIAASIALHIALDRRQPHF